jgi:type II secretory ATPase GspE/PulE/Tfp pilus assembly ATPase PilB-like protein/GAF domain-containing protein
MARFGDDTQTVGQRPRRYIDRQQRLNTIIERLQEIEHLRPALDEMAPHILRLVMAERLRVYERGASGSDLACIYCSTNEGELPRVALSPDSVPGYVALSQIPVSIDDVYDTERLRAVNPRLSFDYDRDQASGYLTRSLLVVPINSGEALLGVLEIINKTAADGFSDQDMTLAQQLSGALADKMRFERESSEGPFEYLLEHDLIAAEQLEEARMLAGEREQSLAHILRTKFEVSTEDIGLSLEQFYQVPFMAYDPDVMLPLDLLETLNKPFLVRNRWVPVAGNRRKVVVLIDNPNDPARIMEIQRIVSAESYEFMVGIEEDILLFLGVEQEEEFAEIEAPEADLHDLVVRLDSEHATLHEGAKGDADELAQENQAAVVQLVNKIIADAVTARASDIHVEPSKGGANGVVRMRIDGVCQPVLDIPSTHVRYIVARIKIMSKIDIAETRLPQDGKIACRLEGQPLELRVATIPTVNGESVIMRLLAAGDPIPFDKLNLTDRNAHELLRMLEHPHGIVLVVGPTGSGKTTSLHALLAKINTPERKILTAEDPVEITQPGLQQLQVRPNIGLDFARALRSFLRADPDVILIGEMRDYETAHSGIEASLTGHLVFSTLHTNSAPETVTRLLDMGLDPLNFSDALIGVMAQRLVRTLCKECKEAYTPDGKEMEQLINAYGPEYFPELGVNEATLELYRPVGCEVCGGIGYRGRTGIHEVLVASERIKAAILERPAATRLQELAMQEGMRTLLQDGIGKVFRGQTDLQQVRTVTFL